MPCNDAGPPCELVDDQFAIMHAPTAGVYFTEPTQLKTGVIHPGCYDQAWQAYPEKVLSQALRLAHVPTHLITVQSRLTRDVLARNDLGQPQPVEIIHKNCEG